MIILQMKKQVLRGNVTWSHSESVAEPQSEPLDPALHPLCKEKHDVGQVSEGTRGSASLHCRDG